MLAGRYGLGDPIGRHGGAVVHHGFDTVLRRSVAVKIFLAYGEEETDVLQEARTAAGLSHPNIAQVYDYGEISDGDRRTPYLVMEFLEGETLADRLARTGAVRWREAAEICTGVAEALAAAHAQGLVHRDVSPRTVMLTPDGVKVVDFEMATASGRNGAGTGADVEALGPLLLACLTGTAARPDGPLPRITGVPRDLVGFYDACATESRPEATAAAEILRRIAGPTQHPRPARPARSRRRTAVMASAAAVAAVLSILGVQLANGTATPGGRSAEAAVEAPHPATTTPLITSLAPTSRPATTSVRKSSATSVGHVRRKAATTPAQRPTTPPASPSSSPSATPTPTAATSSPTPDDTPQPTEPTTAPTTPAPDDTPPVTPSAEPLS
ncbi:protein kinase [Actinoplanes sp. NPDC026619]|uniref:protein kinase domain-containing protein n=1 Tax=Actinoplanes sp. NPDC026619 TaxID=3155798 RepID=UPI0033EA0DDA